MGVMRFLVPAPSRLAHSAAERAYMTGLDGVPWRCRSRLVDGELRIERSVADSGNVHVPYRVAEHAEQVISTGSLIERDRPYSLPVELARGMVHQVRSQLAAWQSIGLVVSEAVRGTLRAATRQLAQAVTQQASPTAAAELADATIDTASRAAKLLADSYVEQALFVRHRQAPQLPTWLGINLGPKLLDKATTAKVYRAFNAGLAPLRWRDVEAHEGTYDWSVYDRQLEWCQANGLKVVAGPLLQLDRLGVPDWLALWEGDVDNLMAFASDYVETVVSRYRGKVDLWYCASRVNSGRLLRLDEEAKLRLAVQALEITRRIDPEAPVLIAFDQPWAEYMAQEECDLAPIHFADALVRSGLQLSALGLELNVGYYPSGSYPRGLFDVSRVLDLWSCLGLPLQVLLTYPSDESLDPLAVGRGRPLPDVLAHGWTPQAQRRWVKHVLPLILTKPNVQGVFWNQLQDAAPHELPHAGLIDAAGVAKPALLSLAKLRKNHLA